MTTQVAIAVSTEIAYERAFEEHWSDVFRFALAWTNDWTAAEDLAQEAFLRLWNHRAHLDWERPVLPWLLVTTRRLATDRYRAARGVATRVLADRAARAGTDMILLTASEATTRGVYAALLANAAAGSLPEATLRASYDRIMALKAGL